MQIPFTFAGLVTSCFALTLPNNGLGPKELLLLQPQELQNESFALSRSTSNRSNGTTDRLVVPIPGAFLSDLKLTTGLGHDRPFLKSSQVMYSGLTTVNSLWQGPNARIRFPITSRTHEFPEIAVVITPSSFKEGLASVDAAASLMRGIFSTVDTNRQGYGGIFMRMDRLPSGDPLGTIHIYRPRREANPASSSNDTLPIALTPAVVDGGSISTATGQGVAANGTCTPACPPLTAGRPIPEDDWLTVFMIPLREVFKHLASAPISSILKPSAKEGVFFNRDGKVKCVLRFYDPALDPARPMTTAYFVAGMLEILRNWAVEDRWREGWGEIKVHGERAITLQIFRVDAAAGSTDGLAIA